MAGHNDLGKTGEELAANLLVDKGYRILDRNWRFQKAEIDIIAQKGNTIVAVEVKTRSTNVFGDPQEFLKPRQKQLLIKAMDAYITQNELDAEVRFDVIGIIKTSGGFQTEHLEDAFFHF